MSSSPSPPWLLPAASIKDRILLVPPRRRAFLLFCMSILLVVFSVFTLFPDAPGRAWQATPLSGTPNSFTPLAPSDFNGIMDGVGAENTPRMSDSFTKGVVLASISLRRGDVQKWLKRMANTDWGNEWSVFHYESDKPNKELNLATPRTTGREAMVFLTYIIDHYPNFPDVVVFHHGHERAWHQPPPTDWLLRAMDMDVVRKHGWISMRCINTPSCAPEETWVDTIHATTPPLVQWNSEVTRGLLQWTFREGDPWYDPSIGDGLGYPPWLGSTCCAQFAVTRERILARSLAFWKRVREPMMIGANHFGNWSKENNEWHMGVGYERSWHYMLGMPGITCQDEAYCRNTLYRGRIWCDERMARWNQSRHYKSVSCTYNDDEAGVHLEFKGEGK